MSTSKKKVLFLITKSNWGGAQRYVYDLATNLDRSQFEPVVALGGTGTLRDMLRHADVRTISIDSLDRDIHIQKEWSSIRTLWSILRDEAPDILHVNSSKAAGVGSLLGRIRRVPKIIFTAHGWAFNEDRPWWQRFIIKMLHWLTVLLSHRTIAVSHAIVHDMNWPGANRKMKVINPGRTIGVMFASQEARATLAAYAPPLQQALGKRYAWIGTIAELHPVKQIDVLIESAATICRRHDHVRFVILGDGSERTSLEERIRAHQLEERVFLLGAIPEAARYLHALSIFVLPSRSEAYGYAAHEAGAARLPVVASDVGGLRDIVTHEHSGLLIPPGEPHALSEALERVLTDHPLAEKLRNNLHTDLAERTVTKMVRATETIYAH